MNNYIDYYYNLYPNTIEKVGRNYRFFLNNEKYYIIMYERNLEEMDTLVKLNKEMIERGSLVHEIVLTKDGKAVFLCDNNSYALLRVYINENIYGKGIGSESMSALKYDLFNRGIIKFDTDTALTNKAAQHFYEKNNFVKEGITRSYYKF